MKNIVIPKSLDKKYAILWMDVNSLSTPMVLKALDRYKPITRREKDIYNWGLWTVLDMMADDGLIKQETLRMLHDKDNNWLPGSSQITVGKVPIMTWLSIGFCVGSLLAGGLSLIVWAAGKIL